MASNKITLTNLGNFNVTGATLSLNGSGDLIIASVLSNPVVLSAKFSLPRSSNTGLGSRLKAFAFNYVLSAGGITSVSAALTRKVLSNNAAVTNDTITLNSPSPSFTSSSSVNNIRPVIEVTTPDFDNQNDNTTIFYNFSLSFTFSGLLSLVSLTVNSLEIEYDYAVPVTQPMPTSTQTIVINKGGNNSTGNGTITDPFLTIAAAVSAISDASPSKRYTIELGPGVYSENLSMPANFHIVGAAAKGATELSGTLDINNSSWTVSGDNRSTFSNIRFSNAAAAAINFTSAPATDGKLSFLNCSFANGCDVTAAVVANDCTFTECTFSDGNFNVTGGNVHCYNCNFESAQALECNSKASVATNLNLFGGISLSGDIRLIHTDTHADLTGNIIGLTVKSGAIDVRGTGTTCNLSSTAVTTPILITGTPTINLISKVTGIGYTPGAPSHWFDPPPTTLQDGVDRILASLQGGTPVLSYFSKSTKA